MSYLHTCLLIFPLAVTDFFQLGPKKKQKEKKSVWYKLLFMLVPPY